jgi:hypothetical protein
MIAVFLHLLAVVFALIFIRLLPLFLGLWNDYEREVKHVGHGDPSDRHQRSFSVVAKHKSRKPIRSSQDRKP